MQAPFNDRWERTKRYLLRNFLVNPGFQLSPIPEEDRSSPDSGSLPDLIVEPAPDRHDHAPNFYEGLERRMKRYYRQLFLGVNNSEDDSSDFEVNRSMASTFMLDIDTRENNVVRNDTIIDSDLDVSITKEKQLTKSTDSDDYLKEREETYADKLIDTFATHDVTRISIDESNKSSAAEDEDEHLKSIETASNETETELSEIIKGNKNKQIDSDERINLTSDFNTHRRLYAEEESEIIETRSVSDDSIQDCHRILTTIAEIHDSPKRGTVQFDNGSPVLIPRVLQFGRTVFGSGIVSRLSGRSISVLETSGKSGDHINYVPIHISGQSDKKDITIAEPDRDVQRLLTASELTRIRIDKTFNTEVVKISETDLNQVADESHEINTGDNLRDSDLDSGKDQDNLRDSDLDSDNDRDILRDSELDNDNDRDNLRDSDLDNDNDRDNLRDSDKDQDNVEADRQDEPEITDTQKASIDWNKDGIDDDDDLVLRKGVFASKARKFYFRSSDESFENLEPIAHSSERSMNEDLEPVEEMREARGSGVNVSWHGDTEQESPALAFEAKTSADKLEDVSSDSNKINASIEEEIETSVEHNIQNLHDYARIIDDFWSVSSVEVNLEDLPKDNSSSNKRRSDSSDDGPSRKRTKDISVQASSDEKMKWGNIKKQLFVGTPLVFRLCGCQDHICS